MYNITNAFEEKEMNNYDIQAKERFGTTDAYQEYEKHEYRGHETDETYKMEKII